MEPNDSHIPVAPPPTLSVGPAASSVFEAPKTSGWLLSLSAAVGLFFLLCGGLGVAASLGNGKSNNPVQSVLPIMTFMMSMSLFWSVIQLLRPHRAALTDTHLVLISRVGRQRIPWADIHKAEMKQEFGGLFTGVGGALAQAKDASKGKVLQIFNKAGKTLVEMPTNFDSFAVLTAEIDRRSREARGQGATSIAVPKKAARRTFILAGAFLLFMGIGSFYMGFEEVSERRALETDSIQTTADIVRLYQFNGFPRVEYSLPGPGGEAVTENTGITEQAYDLLKGQKKVPVIHARNDPANSRLAFGAVEERESSAWILIPGGIVEFLIGAVCLVMAATGISDIKFTGGKLRLVRVGDVETSVPLDASAVASVPSLAPSVDPFAGEPAVPVGIKAFGFLGIGYGALGFAACAILVMAAFGSIFQFGIFYDPTEPPSRALQFWNLISAVAGLLLNIALVACCVGILYLKAWARRFGVGVAGLKFALAAGAVIVSFATIPMGETTSAIAAANHRQDILTHSLGCFGNMGSMLFPMLLLCVLNSKMAKGLFDEAGH